MNANPLVSAQTPHLSRFDIRTGLVTTFALLALIATAPSHADDRAGFDAIDAVPVGGMPADAAPAAVDTLGAGEFVWTPELAPDGPMVIVVSLPEQRLHVYRNGVRIGMSSISSGKAGHETPTGVYPILQKEREHYSNLYNDAPMPYMQRLTWDGIALHAGRVTGAPASHGCIRLPLEFSKKLFEATEYGMVVVVADHVSNGPAVISPGHRVPVDYVTGLAFGARDPLPGSAALARGLPHGMPAAVAAAVTFEVGNDELLADTPE